MIPFNKPCVTGIEQNYVIESIHSDKISGDGEFTKKCHNWFELNLPCKKALLTTSCTHALEMIALLINIQDGDEVIMSSYTFVSTANAFVLRGAKIVFVDIREDTMNIDETKIEEAITDKTKVIVPVHYAGVACEMDTIMSIAIKYNLFVIEDAAQAMMSSYKGKALGTIGHFGTFSFHETKNYTSGGEGGLLIINDENYINRAEIIREKGTNRSAFFRGSIDKYTWVDIGSSYLPSELQSSYLYGNLINAKKINNNRLKSWYLYYNLLIPLLKSNKIKLPFIPKECKHNAHIFYIKVYSLDIRNRLLEYLKIKKILAVFHYIPLHTSPAGLEFGDFNGVDEYTTMESEKLIRLPLFYNIKNTQIRYISNIISNFYNYNKL